MSGIQNPVAPVKVYSKSADYTALAEHQLVRMDVSSAGHTLNLPDPTVAANIGWRITMVVAGSSEQNQATFSTPAGVIGEGGAATHALTGVGATMTVVADGTNYTIVSMVG